MKPDIITTLQLYKEGGRRGETPAEYLSCIFEYLGKNYECRLLLGDVGPLRPGDHATTVPIKFLSPELLKDRLHVGDVFRLREHSLIAEGVIESILW